MKDPRPPRNVVAHMPDGRDIPMECVYLGVDDDGLHVWEAVARLPQLPKSVSMDELPARTTVQLRAVDA